MKPSKYKILINSFFNGWIDQDWNCHATWSWYIKFKCFGYRFWQQLEISYLRRNGICKIMGDINGKHTNIWCEVCGKHSNDGYHKEVFTQEDIKQIKNSPINGCASKYIKLK